MTTLRPSATPLSGAPNSPAQAATPQIDEPAQTANNNSSSMSSTAAAAIVPSTSLQDSGKSRRPRDARLIHMLLASLGVTAYEERVPLQLLDFAYRYTSSTLQDAVYLATEGYPGEAHKEAPREGGKEGGANKAQQDSSTVSLGALRMSIASRLHYQFQPGLPKEFLMDIATERNRVVLPGVSRGYDNSGPSDSGTGQETFMGGIQLPPERFCLTGVGWDLKGEWESEVEDDDAVQQEDGAGTGDDQNGAMEEDKDEEEDEDEGDGKMEDVFGPSDTMDASQDEDKAMTGV